MVCGCCDLVVVCAFGYSVLGGLGVLRAGCFERVWCGF